MQNTVPKKISTGFHNGSNYDYHFIIKKVAKKFLKQFTCLRKYTDKYLILAVSIKKEVTRIYKKGEEVTKNISYIPQFYESSQFFEAYYQL